MSDSTDYNDSDDEIWCEITVSSSSYDNGIIPALMFGAETEEQHMEELETALFCEYIDDIDEEAKGLLAITMDKEEQIRSIVGKYLNDGNEECAFLYFHKYKNEICDDYKYEFIAVCIKLFLEF